MFGWNILFMNPIRTGGQQWRQRWFIKSRGTESTSANFFSVIFFWAPTYWRRLERIFVGKIYSHLPHASFVRCWMWGGNKDWTITESLLLLDILDTWGLLRSPPATRSTTRSRQTADISSTIPFLLFYAVTYFSTGEFPTSKRLHPARQHQRGRQWGCASCAMFPQNSHHLTGTSCAGSKPNCAHNEWKRAWRVVDGPEQNFIWHQFRRHKRGQTPTSSFYWCVKWQCFFFLPWQMLRATYKEENFLLVGLLGQIPLQLWLCCFTLCGLRPLLKPFHIPGLLCQIAL